MADFVYRLGNPVSSVFEPKDTVELKDYYDFFKDYANISVSYMMQLLPPNIEINSRKGQDYFIVTAKSEDSADDMMRKLNTDFKSWIVNTRRKDFDSYGVPLEKLAKINYVKDDPNDRPVSAFLGSGGSTSGYYYG